MNDTKPSTMVLTMAYNNSDKSYGFQHTSADVSIFLDMTVTVDFCTVSPSLLYINLIFIKRFKYM